MKADVRRTSLFAVLVPAIAASSLLLVACGQKNAGKAPAADNVAVVDGHPISRNTYEHYVQGVANRPASELTPEQRVELLDNLIRGELIASEAERSGLAASDDTRAVLDLSRLTVLQQASSQAYLKDRKATDAELKAEYDSQVALMPRTEYRVRHILVNTEEFARNVISQLERGADFARLATKESLDNGSRDRGGELDWFSPDRMVPPFSEAVGKLDKGQYTKEPVQTSFGWHVIKLEDRRDVAPPPLDSVRDRLVQIVESKKFRAHTDELMAAAKIERTLEKPGSVEAAPASTAPAAGEPAPSPMASPALEPAMSPSPARSPAPAN